ncbi:biotin--[acetyl-CoA-carboxylase] ligase [Roseibium algae]|uniref:biotin--[biotin carboxyl-carrier protein] ligase n=1 Tax=Roseibium algae TaxID=3123038 RepID=A0ABU8TJH6_9HYPH
MASGLRVERHDDVASTNTLAFERARSGDPGDLWIIAQDQSSGRGRRGRQWASMRGNLFASYLMLNPGPRSRIGELPLVAAVSLAEAIDKCAGTHQMVGLKWPNDLLVDGAKLSGILLEAETVSSEQIALVLGFGVNCVQHPKQGLYPTVDLAALGYRITAEDLFGSLALSLGNWLEHWRQPQGFEVVRKAWLARAIHLGKIIKVRNGDREMSGTFLDLDDRGHMILGLENGQRETILAGDVFIEGS